MEYFSNIIDEQIWAHPLKYIFIYVTIMTTGGVILCYRHRRIPINISSTERAWRAIEEIKVLPYLVLGVYIALIPAWQDFTFFDANHLFKTLDIDKEWLPPPIWPKAGRLFPLSDQEFRYLALVSPTIFFYEFIFSLEVVAVIALLCRLIDKIYTPAALALVITNSAFTQAYFGLVFPERNLVFFLALFAVALDIWICKGKIWALALGLFCAATLIFYKELGVILTGTVGTLCVIKELIKNQQDCDRIIYAGWALLASSIGWCFIYIIAIYPQIDIAYHTLRSITFTETLEALAIQPWPWLLLIIARERIVSIARKASTIDPLWDGLIIGSVFYGGALASMRFDLPYYYSPPAVITLIALFRSGVQKVLGARWLEIVIFIIFIQTYQTAQTVIPYKELVAAKSDAAKYIGYLKSSTKKVTIHYLDISDYEAGLFSGLLDAKYSLEVHSIVSSKGIGPPIEKCTNSINMPACNHDQPPKLGDIAISFKKPHPLVNTILLHASEPIGFWKNNYRVYIYEFRN